jgi:guanylate kinase
VPPSLRDSADGHLVVVSGPSGVGKSSILAAVIDRTNSVFSVSATTRPPRQGERDGREYHFLTRPDFEERIASGEVLEWAEYGGNLYGTLKDEVLPILATGSNVVLDIENEGARQIRASYPDAVLIFVRPPTIDELERRLRGRGDTSEQDIERRLAVAASQIDDALSLYDHIIVNDDLDAAVGRVLGILTVLADERQRHVAPSTTDDRGDLR